MTTYGYVRVSSLDQNEDRQLDAMRGFGVAARDIYIDKQSGKDFERPAAKAPENFSALVRQWENGRLPLEGVIERTGLKKATFFRRLREFRTRRRK
jgi:hypothetical protein